MAHYCQTFQTYLWISCAILSLLRLSLIFLSFLFASLDLRSSHPVFFSVVFPQFTANLSGNRFIMDPHTKTLCLRDKLTFKIQIKRNISLTRLLHVGNLGKYVPVVVRVKVEEEGTSGEK